MTKIYTLTLAPSLDSATQTRQIYPEGKLRCSAPVFEPGGGGINVARAVTFSAAKPPPFSRLAAPPASTLPPCWPMSRCRSRPSKPRLDATEPARSRAASGEQYRFVMPGAALTDDESAAWKKKS